MGIVLPPSALAVLIGKHARTDNACQPIAPGTADRVRI